jgi:hypothetical protein
MVLWPEKVTADSLSNSSLVGMTAGIAVEGSPNLRKPSGGIQQIKTWAESLLYQDSDGVVNFTVADVTNRQVVTTQSCKNNTFDGHTSGTSINVFISRAITTYVSGKQTS